MTLKLSLVIALVLVLGNVVSAGENVPVISNQEVYQQIKAKKAPLILDVRSEEEYLEGHIPGAVLIPHSQLAERVEELSAYKDQPVYVYCRSGRRAGIAEEYLQEAGFSQLYHIEGDMNAWQEAKLLLEK